MAAGMAFSKVALAAGLVGMMALGGCMNRGQTQTAAVVPSGPAPTRAAGGTAPTDLQLVCASEAATRFGVANALPTASAPAGANTFEVQLTLGDGNAICLIDTNGSVQSLARA